MANLDHRCEVWLSKNFGLYLDFAIESTLPTLVEEGLIWEQKTGNEVMLAISIWCLHILGQQPRHPFRSTSQQKAASAAQLQLQKNRGTGATIQGWPCRG